MTTPAPARHQAQHALDAARQQQAGVARAAFARRPAGHWLATAPLYVLLGLALDLLRSTLGIFTLFGLVVIAVLATVRRARRRRQAVPARPAWLGQHFDDRAYWIFAAWVVVLIWATELAGAAFARAGLAWPDTLAGCAAAAMFLVTGPLVARMLRRRVTFSVVAGRQRRDEPGRS